MIKNRLLFEVIIVILMIALTPLAGMVYGDSSGDGPNGGAVAIQPGNTENGQTDRENELVVMCYNIHHGRGGDGVINLSRIADVILESKADLVALQEVDVETGRSGGVDQVQELARLTGMHGAFALARPYDGGLYGQAVLSRWPIEEMQVSQLPGPTPTDERIAGMASIAGGSPFPDLLFVTTHLHHADAALRLEQAKHLVEILAGRELPDAILAGDFNAVPGSQTMQMILEQWEDTTSPGALTFPATNPDRKIDWILLPGGHHWRVVSSEVIPEAVASDHRPVVIKLKRKKGTELF